MGLLGIGNSNSSETTKKNTYSQTSKTEKNTRQDQAVQGGSAISLGADASAGGITVKRADENALETANKAIAQSQGTLRNLVGKALGANASTTARALDTVDLSTKESLHFGREAMERAESATEKALGFASNVTRTATNSDGGRAIDSIGKWGAIGAGVIALALVMRGSGR